MACVCQLSDYSPSAGQFTVFSSRHFGCGCDAIHSSFRWRCLFFEYNNNFSDEDVNRLFCVLRIIFFEESFFFRLPSFLSACLF